jgi:hypothetical protein
MIATRPLGGPAAAGVGTLNPATPAVIAKPAMNLTMRLLFKIDLTDINSSSG